MAIITLKAPNTPYRCETDTGVMLVEIREAYNGVTIISDSGRKLSIALRDNGFELSLEENLPDLTHMPWMVP